MINYWIKKCDKVYIWTKTSAAEIHRQLVEVYGVSLTLRKHVWFQCTEFDKGRTDVQDEQRLEHPSTSIASENVCCASVMHDLSLRFRWEILEYPTYRPNLAPSDFNLFKHLKKHLGGRHFRNKDIIQQAICIWLHNLDANFFYAGFDMLVYRWSKCFDNHGNYVEKCELVPYYDVHIFEFKKKIFHPEVSLPYFLNSNKLKVIILIYIQNFN